jgi:predicted TIM-barrel fold metal-dependent hydrolase
LVDRINDSHIHVGQIFGINQFFRPESIPVFIKENNLDKVLIMGNDTEPELGNQMVEYLADNLPNVYGLYWYMWGSNKIKLTNKIIGIKYHGGYTHKPVKEMSHHVLEALNSQKKILLVHCGRYLEGEPKSTTSWMHALYIADKYPDIKVILAHMGGTDTTICKQAIDAASRCNGNVYFDTSGITTPYIIEYACDKLPVTRILFGSDAPWCSFKSMYHTVNDAVISELSKQDILHDNFELLLK